MRFCALRAYGTACMHLCINMCSCAGVYLCGCVWIGDRWVGFCVVMGLCMPVYILRFVCLCGCVCMCLDVCVRVSMYVLLCVSVCAGLHLLPRKQAVTGRLLLMWFAISRWSLWLSLSHGNYCRRLKVESSVMMSNIAIMEGNERRGRGGVWFCTQFHLLRVQ